MTLFAYNLSLKAKMLDDYMIKYTQKKKINNNWPHKPRINVLLLTYSYNTTHHLEVIKCILKVMQVYIRATTTHCKKLYRFKRDEYTVFFVFQTTTKPEKLRYQYLINNIGCVYVSKLVSLCHLSWKFNVVESYCTTVTEC